MDIPPYADGIGEGDGPGDPHAESARRQAGMGRHARTEHPQLQQTQGGADEFDELVKKYHCTIEAAGLDDCRRAERGLKQAC